MANYYLRKALAAVTVTPQKNHCSQSSGFFVLGGQTAIEHS